MKLFSKSKEHHLEKDAKSSLPVSNKEKFINYFKADFGSDLKAGFITAVVALPLAIAFAIASGVSPIMGLYTAIIAGILGSMFGGSNFSITGPTGAMAVIILSTVTQFGLEGLLLAGFLAGIIQIFLGLMKMGKLVKFIPLPVIAGFTAGIGAVIFIGQIGNFLGVIIPSKEHVWETFIEIFHNLPNLSLIAIGISLFTIIILAFYPKISRKVKYLKNIPPSIIALIISIVIIYFLALKIPVVGELPRSLPELHFVRLFDFELIKDVLPSAFTIAMLGSIEALLCAVVCDGMTNTKHKSDKELISQGFTNLISPLFGGMPATAAIARSAVNIREGAKTRFAGVIHGVVILLVLLFFAPFAKYIPKAFLAGVLMVVAIKMINYQEIKIILKTSKSEILVFLVTFLLTIFTDLVFAVQIGILLAIFLIFIKLTQIVSISNMEDYDSNGEFNSIINKDPKLKDKVSIYTIHGPFFFGAMNVFDSKLREHMYIQKPVIIIRMKHVPFIDSTGIMNLIGFLEKRKKKNSRVIFTEFWPGVKEELFKNDEFRTLVSNKDIFKTVQNAFEDIKSYKN